MSELVKENNGLNEAVEGKVEAKYMERLEQFIEQSNAKKEEAKQVVRVNQDVLDIVLDSKSTKKNVREAKESFETVIELNNNVIATIDLKVAAAERIRETIKANKEINVLEFLVDFDRMAGN